jgi:uncharacterized membrane protein
MYSILGIVKRKLFCYFIFMLIIGLVILIVLLIIIFSIMRIGGISSRIEDRRELERDIQDYLQNEKISH